MSIHYVELRPSVITLLDWLEYLRPPNPMRSSVVTHQGGKKRLDRRYRYIFETRGSFHSRGRQRWKTLFGRDCQEYQDFSWSVGVRVEF